MTALTLPIETAPGQYPQESGGRLINMFAEQLADTASAKTVLRRVAGLTTFGTTTQTGYRGSIAVGNVLFSAFANTAVYHGVGGGAGTNIPGALAGTVPVLFARNNNATPDLVAVSPGDGAFTVATTGVSSYPGTTVGQPSSVCNVKGFFIFGYGNGLMRNSDLNSTNINTNSYASAEAKPDALLRVVATPDGGLLAAGSESLEFWGGQNDTGFIFSFITARLSGIAGPYCITGDQDGWPHGLYGIGSNFVPFRLDGYTPTPIGHPDLNRLIAAVSDKTTIQMSVYVAGGNSFVIVRSPTWTWLYHVQTGKWHERQSYLLTYWRGLGGVKFAGLWLVGDTATGSLNSINETAQTALGNPIVCEVQTGPVGSFPYGAVVKRLDILMSVGVGIAPGQDPIQTTPSIEISMSKDNGLSWTQPWVRSLGAQATFKKVSVYSLGHVKPHGVKLKFRVSDPVHVGIMGADIDATPIGK